MVNSKRSCFQTFWSENNTFAWSYHNNTPTHATVQNPDHESQDLLLNLSSQLDETVYILGNAAMQREGGKKHLVIVEAYIAVAILCSSTGMFGCSVKHKR